MANRGQGPKRFKGLHDSPRTVTDDARYFWEKNPDLPLTVVAKKFGIPVNTLSVACRRELWRVKHIEDTLHRAIVATHRDAVMEEKEKHDKYVREVFRRASAKALEALEKKLSAPENWKDLDIADRIARRAAGLDVDGDADMRNQFLVNVNTYLAAPDPEPIPPTIDA